MYIITNILYLICFSVDKYKTNKHTSVYFHKITQWIFAPQAINIIKELSCLINKKETPEL